MFACGFMISVNLFFVGILGVYVARIYDEVRGRPTYMLGRVRAQKAAGVRTDLPHAPTAELLSDLEVPVNL